MAPPKLGARNIFIMFLGIRNVSVRLVVFMSGFDGNRTHFSWRLTTAPLFPKRVNQTLGGPVGSRTQVYKSLR